MNYKIFRAVSAPLFIALLLTGCVFPVSFSQYQLPEQAEESAIETGEEIPALHGEALPEYRGEIRVELNDNKPFFTGDDLSRGSASFETYGELDALGRCTAAMACVGTDLMPGQERESISEIHPTGWKQAWYSFVDQEALYNRCHLIAYQLTGENANERNLITGTRTMNDQGMKPLEELVGNYVRSTGNHVLYRVTPVFAGQNLLADGVLMEARSVEDEGKGVEFCVYCFNREPGVTIDYTDGSSAADGTIPEADTAADGEITYVLNTRSMKFHLPDCEGLPSGHNRRDVDWTRDEVIRQGYEPCGICRP